MQTSQYDKKIIGTGVLPTSQVCFYSPTSFAKNALYYIGSIGDYQCDKTYNVERESLNSFLLFVITSGELHFDYHNRHFIAPEGTVVVLDCKQYHHYYSTDYVSFKFFHFHGSGSQAYCDMFVAMGNPIFFPNDFADINSIFLQIMYAFSVPSINIHRISLLIHTILCKLVAACQEETSTTKQIVNDVVQYINDHYTEKLTVNQLASSCNLSVFYFIRLFERIHNCTPHEYILNMRLTHAKRLLLTTRMSVAEISVSAGFSTPSNFIRSFKSALSYTPHQFRTLHP